MSTRPASHEYVWSEALLPQKLTQEPQGSGSVPALGTSTSRASPSYRGLPTATAASLTLMISLVLQPDLGTSKYDGQAPPQLSGACYCQVSTRERASGAAVDLYASSPGRLQ